jgi:hypothetical protein
MVALAMLGCGGPTYQFTPVSGVVLLDGKPARGIMVQFMPDVMEAGQGPTSFAVTDEDGKFTLKTYEGQEGAVIGNHVVTLTDTDEERPEQGTVAKKGPRLAARFSSPGPNGLKVTVKAGGEPIKIEASAK